MDLDRLEFQRQTYDFLRLGGDLGGLKEFLFLIVQFVFGWYAYFKQGSFIMQKLY
jgi:hypothetical protein